MRRRLTWIIFTVCILAVLEGLGYVTWHALRLERRELEAQRAAQFQQLIRLALWRMESEVTPIIAAEAARPYFHYISFYPAERAYTKMFQQVKPNEVLVPSPLLEASSRFVRLHYQFDAEGRLSSPQAPTGNQRDLAEAQYLDSEFIVLAGQRLDEVGAMMRPRQPQSKVEAAPEPRQARDNQDQRAQAPQPETQSWQVEDSEYKAREKAAQTAQQSISNVDQQRRKSQDKSVVDRSEPARQFEGADDGDRAKSRPEAARPAAPPPPTAGEAATARTRESYGRDEPAKDAVKEDAKPQSLLKQYQAAGPLEESSRVEQGAFAAHWHTNPSTGDEELMLERVVQVDGREVRQGVWIEWAELRRQLMDSITDLLPAATLSPALDTVNEAGPRLAAIPVRLVPGTMPAVQAAGVTPTHVTLLVTWGAVLGAIAAIGMVLRKAMELSERRGRFVSAVTHELRTPLTTFCLYTEMLADGMVPEEASRRQYLGTLKSESTRLAKIVQNVLDYAGIGGAPRKAVIPAEATSTEVLLESLRPALDQCAARCGMHLEVQIQGDAQRLRADPQTVERILLNLVENAGKYAGEAQDRRIHLTVASCRGGRPCVEFRVRDHGPGVPKSERRKIFHAFHRAERDAHGTKSGLGLGLALARELASELGGKLHLNPRWEGGAEFILRVPSEP